MFRLPSLTLVPSWFIALTLVFEHDLKILTIQLRLAGRLLMERARSWSPAVAKFTLLSH